MIRYIKTQNYYIPLDYQPRKNEVFRLCVAWCAGVAGFGLWIGAAAWMMLR